eukprot:2242678-Amphidinium_carterae.2
MPQVQETSYPTEAPNSPACRRRDMSQLVRTNLCTEKGLCTLQCDGYRNLHETNHNHEALPKQDRASSQ